MSAEDQAEIRQQVARCLKDLRKLGVMARRRRWMQLNLACEIAMRDVLLTADEYAHFDDNRPQRPARSIAR